MPYRTKTSGELAETFVEESIVMASESPVNNGTNVNELPVFVCHKSRKEAHLHITIPTLPCEPQNDVIVPPAEVHTVTPSHMENEVFETSKSAVPSPSDSEEDISECDTTFLRKKISQVTNEGFIPVRRAYSESTPVSPGRVERCDLCGKTFHSVPALRRHVMIHARQRSLDLPAKRYSESAHECTQCGKLFENAAYLEKHKLNRHSEKKFKCNVCSNQFTTKALRDNHRRTHFGENPFSCTIV